MTDTAHKWGQELTLSTGRTLTLEPRAGCLVELRGTVSADGQWAVMFLAGGRPCYGGIHTGESTKRGCVPLLPAADQLSPDPAERMREAWELLGMLPDACTPDGDDPLAPEWEPVLIMPIAGDHEETAANMLVMPYSGDGITAETSCTSTTDPAVLRTAANRMEALQAWLASLAGEEQRNG